MTQYEDLTQRIDRIKAMINRLEHDDAFNKDMARKVLSRLEDQLVNMTVQDAGREIVDVDPSELTPLIDEKTVRVRAIAIEMYKKSGAMLTEATELRRRAKMLLNLFDQGVPHEKSSDFTADIDGYDPRN